MTRKTDPHNDEEFGPLKWVIVLVLIAIVGLSLWGVPAFSQTTGPYTANPSWPKPVGCDDGTPITNCPVTGYRLEKLNGTAWVITHDNIPPTTSELSIPGLTVGSHSWRIWSLPITVGRSVPSPVTVKVFGQPVPLPPSGITVTYKATETTAYRVAPNWATFAFVKGEAIGTVAIDTRCELRSIGEYHYVLKSKVTAYPGTSKPDYAVVKCG